MEVIRVSVDVFCAILGCALGISPATSYSGVTAFGRSAYTAQAPDVKNCCAAEFDLWLLVGHRRPAVAQAAAHAAAPAEGHADHRSQPSLCTVRRHHAAS